MEQFFAPRRHKLPESSHLSCRKRELTKVSSKNKLKPFGNTNVTKYILNITRSDVKRKRFTSIRLHDEKLAREKDLQLPWRMLVVPRNVGQIVWRLT